MHALLEAAPAAREHVRKAQSLATRDLPTHLRVLLLSSRIMSSSLPSSSTSAMHCFLVLLTRRFPLLPHSPSPEFTSGMNSTSRLTSRVCRTGVHS